MTEKLENLAQYRRCIERIRTNWPEFLRKRSEKEN